MFVCKAAGICELQQSRVNETNWLCWRIRRGYSKVTVSAQRGPMGMRFNPMSINPEQNQ
jgi:hypothetical protein